MEKTKMDGMAETGSYHNYVLSWWHYSYDGIATTNRREKNVKDLYRDEKK